MGKSNRKSTGKASKPETAAPDPAKRVVPENLPPTTAHKPRIKKIDHDPVQDQAPSTQTTMEVHHHPQLDHSPKPIKEYFLEGFMIFIAVMMGFIAENIREGITNNEHARQLTSQLARDLKEDIARLDEGYRGESQMLRKDDTLIFLLQQKIANADLKKIQRTVTDSHSMWPFYPSMGAITAIKNEVHLKQFSNSDIVRYIAKYEAHISLLRIVQDITLQYQRNFLDPFLYQHVTPANLQAAFSKLPVSEEPMRNLKQDDLTQLAAQMILVRINTSELVKDNRQLKNDAQELLKYIKKQYNLDE